MSKKDNRKDMEEIEYEFINKRKKRKLSPVLLIILGVIGVFSLFVFTDFFDELIDKGGFTLNEDKEVAMDKDFATGLRLASLERYDEAISYFEKVKFSRLNEDDQQLVLMTYLYSGNEQKALDLNKEIDEEIINVLLKNNDLEKLKKLVTDSELIQFEIAILDNDFEKIIELKDTARLEKDSRRANAIANAYYQTGQTEEAINFTAMMASSGINMWEAEGKVISTDDQSITTNIENEKEKTSLVGVFIFILFILFIGFVIYFIFINKDNIKNELEARRERRRKLKIEKLKKKSVGGKKKVENKDENIEPTEQEIENDNGRKEDDDKYSYHYDE